mmetsp:Transcript_42956/g.130717  ORF Transcript_42956/g.130717 Transcript_42956/m.130717 type:complete len:227 (+) Transcript_42956:1061-1741(+)
MHQSIVLLLGHLGLISHPRLELQLPSLQFNLPGQFSLTANLLTTGPPVTSRAYDAWSLVGVIVLHFFVVVVLVLVVVKVATSTSRPVHAISTVPICYSLSPTPEAALGGSNGRPGVRRRWNRGIHHSLPHKRSGIGHGPLRFFSAALSLDNVVWNGRTNATSLVQILAICTTAGEPTSFRFCALSCLFLILSHRSRVVCGCAILRAHFRARRRPTQFFDSSTERWR